MADKYPKKLTLLSAVLTLAIIGVLGVQQFDLLKYTNVLKNKHIPMTELSGMIIHVDDMLTDSTYLSVLTADPRWGERYQQYQPAMQYSTNRFMSLVGDADASIDEVKKVTASRKGLFEIENKVYQLLRDNKRKQAFSLLDSSSYSDKKREYTRTIYDITGSFAKKRADTLKAKTELVEFTFWTFIVGLAVLIGIWGVLVNVFIRAEHQNEKMIQQLTHGSKLMSLGTLSSGVAEELEGPTQQLKQKAEAILNDGSVGQQAKQNAQEIVEASSAIHRIAGQLISLASGGDNDGAKPIKLNDTVNDSLLLLREQLHSNGIELRLTLADGLPNIVGDPQSLQSVFENLITNSRDAFEGRNGSKFIAIETERHPSGGITVTYKDNAGGMPKEIQKQLFDPFFSTKGGKGTGLGMSIIRSIVEQHNGTLNVETELNQGTTFTLNFPTVPTRSADFEIPKAA